MTKHSRPAERRGVRVSDGDVGKDNAQREISQVHWERLVRLGYAVRRRGHDLTPVRSP